MSKLACSGEFGARWFIKRLSIVAQLGKRYWPHYSLRDAVSFLPLLAIAMAFVSGRTIASLLALLALAIASIIVAILEHREPDLGKAAYISLWAVIGAVIAFLSGRLTLETLEAEWMLPIAAVTMFLCVLYGARQARRLCLWLIVGQIVGLVVGYLGYSERVHGDFRPQLLLSVVGWCTAITVLFAHVALLFVRATVPRSDTEAMRLTTTNVADEICP